MAYIRISWNNKSVLLGNQWVLICFVIQFSRKKCSDLWKIIIFSISRGVTPFHKFLGRLSSDYVKTIPNNKGVNKIAENTKYLLRTHNLFITKKLSLQLKELSNCDSFTVITVLHDKDVLTWDYKNSNKNQVTMS